MTNKEIKEDIQKRLAKDGEELAFINMVIENGKCLKPQLNPNLLDKNKLFMFINSSISLTVRPIIEYGLRNSFKNKVFTVNGQNNVISDEIYARAEKELLKII